MAIVLLVALPFWLGVGIGRNNFVRKVCELINSFNQKLTVIRLQSEYNTIYSNY